MYRTVSRFFVALVLAALTALLPLFSGCGGCQGGSLSQPAPIPLPDKTVRDDRSTQRDEPAEADTAEQRAAESEEDFEDLLPSPGTASDTPPTPDVSSMPLPTAPETETVKPAMPDQATVVIPPPSPTPIPPPVKSGATVPSSELSGPAPQPPASEAESATASPETTQESSTGPVRNISPIRNIPPVRNISPVRSIPPVRQAVPVETEPSAMNRPTGIALYPVVFARIVDEEESENAQEKGADAVSESPVPETPDNEATPQNGEEPPTEPAPEKNGATPDKKTVEATSPEVSPATAPPAETTDTEKTETSAPLSSERRSEDGPGPRQDYDPPGERRDEPRRDYGSRREYGPPGERRGERMSGADREREFGEDASSTDTAAKTDDADAPSGWATKKHIRFNFQFQPWKDVIPWFAELSELSLERTNFPSGTLNLTDPQVYTAEEALDILNSVLLFREYTLIRKGRMLVALYLPDGIPPNLLDPISPDELDRRGRYELVRVLFNLNRTTPEVIQAEIEKMLGPQGSIVTLPKSQQVLVTETGGNLRAIRDIIKRIDDPNDTASSAINMVEMRNMSADEALAILLKLLGIEENDASLRTAVDATGSKIWLTGRADMIERAREIITTIDTAYDTVGTKREGDPQFLIYETGTADPNTVLAVLQTLLATSPDPDRRLSIDPRTGGIALLARIPDHNLAKATIEQMQLSARTVAAIPLGTLSPSKAVELLKSILTPSETASSTSTTKTAGTLPPATIEADTANRRLIVYGTPVQIEEIKNILAALGESGSGKAAQDNRSVRILSMPPAAAAMVLEQLPELWSAVQPGNEIKVVNPSAMIPSRSTTDLTPNRMPTISPASPTTAPASPGTNVPAQERPIAVPETDEQRIQRIIREHYRTNESPAGPTTYYRRKNQTGSPSPVYRSVVWTRVADDEDAAVPAGNPDDMAVRLAALEAENRRMRALLQVALERLQAVEKAEPQHPTTSAAKPELPTVTTMDRTAPLPPETSQDSRMRQISPETLDRLPPELRERIRRAQSEFRNRDTQAASRQPEIPEPAIRETPNVIQGAVTGASSEVRSAPPETQTVPAPPVVVSASPGGLMITSEDTEALTRLEDLIRMLSDESVLGKQMKVYYIKNATAEVVAQTLKSIMGTGSYSADDTSLPNIESEDAAAVVSLLEAGMSYEATATWAVTVEPRLNALLIQANPVDHWTIEKLLPLLDQENPSGNDIKRLSKTRMIPLHNIRAEDAMAGIKEIFAANLDTASGGAGAAANRGGRQQQQGQQRGNMPMPPMMPGMPGGPEMMQQIMARMGGRGGTQASTTLREEPQKMTLAVDNRSNSLIVHSPEALFLDVKDVVEMLDAAAAYQEIVTETHVLKNVSPAMVRDMINNLGSSAISIGTSSTTTTSGAVDGTGTTGTTSRWGTGGTGGFQFRPGGTGGGFPFGGMQMRPGGMGGGGTQMRPGGMGGGR